MSDFKISQQSKTTLRVLSAVLMAGTIAGCSSDLSRFSYDRALSGDQLTTASVKTPHSDSLAPVGVGTQAFPGDYRQPGDSAPTYVSQAYPGAQPAQSPIYTSSIPNHTPAPVRVLAPSVVGQPVYQTSNVQVPTGLAPVALAPAALIAPSVPAVQQTVSVQPVVSAPLPAASRVPFAQRVRNALTPKPKATLQNTVEQAAVQRMPIIRPITDRSVATNVDRIQTSSIAPNVETMPLVPMAPDMTVTGAIPSKTSSSKGGWSTINASRVTLSEGETVYNLSRRYGVPAVEILNANGISDSRQIKAGQSLIIPTYVYSKVAPVSAPDNDVLTQSANSYRGSKTLFPRGASAPLPILRDQGLAVTVPQTTQSSTPNFAAGPTVPTPRKVVASNTVVNSGSGYYTVSSGDTLNRIAFKNGVKVADLQAANGLTNSNIRIGQKLVVPGASFKNLAPDPTTTASITNVVPSVKPKTIAQAPVKKDDITQTAKVDTGQPAPEKTGIDKLRWPAKGQISSSFGGKTDGGKRNDGLDILMPEGSDVKAAENGVVIYASNGLKGFGNTVLVRHDGELVTVYAHAKSLNVKRGDKVQRGQVIAQSGMTGSAKRPKLHFEVRHKATPKNPIIFLE
jgi:murein DD-endopeptidase MepM/ murein hydrolase activator NlpD